MIDEINNPRPLTYGTGYLSIHNYVARVACVDLVIFAWYWYKIAAGASS